jgi:hypothetical protein
MGLGNHSALATFASGVTGAVYQPVQLPPCFRAERIACTSPAGISAATSLNAVFSKRKVCSYVARYARQSGQSARCVR